VNAVSLVGKLTRAPIMRFENEGAETCTFTLAVQEPPSREGKAWTLYIPCTSWGATAERCGLLEADTLVSVQGRLTWRKQKASCQQEHSQLVVNVKQVEALLAAEMPA
jgi:single-strand DNA-binding protein